MGEHPRDIDIKRYVEWKKKIQAYLKLEFSNIYSKMSKSILNYS